MAGLLGLVLTAFAANSLLCRMALGGASADPLPFTAVRLVSGAMMLALLCGLRGGLGRPLVNAPAALCLFVYAMFFSIAYVALDTATGALLLFASVQATMIVIALWRGERPARLAWCGFALAALGLASLLFPGFSAPPWRPAVEMAVAGAAWAVYTLIGTRGEDPLRSTTWNFLWASPPALLALAFPQSPQTIEADGALLAILSGAVASGLGYALWYRVLPRLSILLAATAQLAVPVLAAAGGV
ncbi:MAG: EamA family transporter, partial [Gammaproteobacteria bacterium]